MHTPFTDPLCFYSVYSCDSFHPSNRDFNQCQLPSERYSRFSPWIWNSYFYYPRLDYYFLLYHALLFNTFHICIFNWNLCIVPSFPLWTSQHQESQTLCICTEWMNSWINGWGTINYDFSFFLTCITLDWSNKYINLYMLTFMFISPTVRIGHFCGIWSFYHIYMRKLLYSQIDYKMRDIRRRNKCILSPKPIQRCRDSWLHHWMGSLARA